MYSPESPDSSSCGVALIVVIFDSVLLLILDQEVAEGALFQGDIGIFPAPYQVHLIEFPGTDGSRRVKSKIAGGFHERDRIVGFLPDNIPTFPGAFAFREGKMMTHQSAQSLKSPEENSF